MQERRKSSRLTYPCKISISSEEGEESFTLHTENISSGGARVILQDKLSRGTPLTIELSIGKERIKTQGRVVWVLDITTPGAKEPDLFDTGVEFTSLSLEDRAFLSRQIEDMMKITG